MNLTHLHVLFHGGDVDLVSDLQLVVVAGIHQHLVIESPVPHLTSGILCSLGEYGDNSTGHIDRKNQAGVATLCSSYG